jgi:two-component system, OmpR family, sensor histidine kinase TctE
VSGGLPSLASRMGWHVLAPLALVWLLGTAVSLSLAWHYTQRGLDRALLDDAQAIASSVRLEPVVNNPAVGSTPVPRRLVTGLSSDELGFLLFDHSDSTFFAIFDGQGRMLVGHPGMSLTALPATANAFVFDDVGFEGQSVRRVTLRKDLPAPFFVIAAETKVKRNELLRSLALYSVLPQVLLLFALAFWLRRTIGRDLSPLADLSDEVGRRSAQDLSPVREDGRSRELQSLSGNVNALLERLDASIRGHREFVGNVAHELRTPLAGMKALAEHGMAQSDPLRWQEALQKIASTSDRAAHLTSQLLALALAQEARSENAFGPVRLDEVVREAVLRHMPRAHALGVDLGADGVDDGTDAPVTVRAHPALLAGMIDNLIDNALLHGAPPQGATACVTVGVVRPSPGSWSSRHEVRNGGPTLFVEDNGLGVPMELREEVFGRLYRGPGASGRELSAGAGLGLSIVREYAQLMQAQASLQPAQSGPGARFEVSFGAQRR